MSVPEEQNHVSRADRAEVKEAYRRVLAGSDVRERSVEVRPGERVHVLEKGDGPPLVMLHGTASSAPFLFPLLGHLDDVRAMAVDRPGQGLSDPIDLPRHGYRQAVIAWGDRLLDALGLETTALLGHSTGGLWAVWYALARPARVDRLLLIGAAPALPLTRCPFPIRMIATPGVGRVLDRLAPPSPKSMMQLARFMGEEETLADHPAVIDLLVATGRDRVAAVTDRAEVQVIVSPFALVSPSGFRRRARVQPVELRRLAVPTLVVWGDREPVGSVADARAVTDLIPDAHLEVLPAGHAPLLGHGRRIAAIATEFLATKRSTR